jgi:hypothetical protein
VDVMAVLTGERPEQLTVRVVGQPSGIEIGTRVRFRDLSARTWEMGDRQGVALKASRVEPFATGQGRWWSLPVAGCPAPWSSA